MYSKLAVVAVALVAAAGVFADDFTNNCNAQKRVCQNGGVCHENVATPIPAQISAWADPYCVCQAPYGDSDCSRTIRECKDSPCQNGATCHPATCTGSHDSENYDCFTCECPFGWGGSPSYAGGNNPSGLCDWKLMGNDCRNGNLCANGGTCTSQGSPSSPFSYGYSCQCPTGTLGGSTRLGGFFANVAYNCTVADCTTSDGACQNGGTCVAGSGSTANRCSCGFYGGYRCEQPRFCDNPTACPDGYTCSNTGAGTGSCTAPSFCSTHTCGNGGTCMTSGGPGGGAYCACPGTFDGGLSCNSTTFCASNPCMNSGTCVNDLSYVGNQGHCVCSPDFGGQFCEKPVVGCASGRTKNTDSYKCAAGVASCSTADYVSTCGCPYNIGGLSHYDCGCNSTFVSKCPGTAGGMPGIAADMVCQNGGLCVEAIDGTNCACRPGFWGDKCQNYDNPCLNNPCENGGQCYMTAETTAQTYTPSTTTYSVAFDDRMWAWRCKCKWPFYGKNCEKQAPVSTADGKAPVVCGAANSPCLNGGTCRARTYSTVKGGFFFSDPNTGKDVEAEPWQCSCPSVNSVQLGWKGQTCEVAVEQCTTSTCQNNGKCTSLSSGVQCTCPCGYAGDRCQFTASNMQPASIAQFANDGFGGIGYSLEFCSAEPCQNGGTCYHTTDGQGFGCNCKSGWGGLYCQYGVRSAAAGVLPSLAAVAAAVAVAFALKH